MVLLLGGTFFDAVLREGAVCSSSEPPFSLTVGRGGNSCGRALLSLQQLVMQWLLQAFLERKLRLLGTIISFDPFSSLPACLQKKAVLSWVLGTHSHALCMAL